MPKLHDKNYKDVFRVPLMFYQHSFPLTKKLTAAKEKLHEYCATVYLRGSENQMWILNNSLRKFHIQTFYQNQRHLNVFNKT